MSFETALRFRTDRRPKTCVSRKRDEFMDARQNVMKNHKYNDFWDILVKDLDRIEQKAKEEQGEEENKQKEDKRKSAFKVNQRTLWNESQELACWKRRIRRERTVVNAETKMFAKALLIQRREALRQLLDKEQEMWEKELTFLGITVKDQLI